MNTNLSSGRFLWLVAGMILLWPACKGFSPGNPGSGGIGGAGARGGSGSGGLGGTTGGRSGATGGASGGTGGIVASGGTGTGGASAAGGGGGPATGGGGSPAIGSGGAGATGGAGGAGGAAECSGSAKQCRGLQPQTCNAGHWQDSGSVCPNLCTAGACAGSCRPSTVQCSGLQPQVCDATGTWMNSGAACTTSCVNGACPVACTSGACSTGNMCKTGETCTAGMCGGGTTVTCTTADPCMVPGTCNPASGCPAPTPKVCGSGQTCSAGQCVCTAASCPTGCCSGNTCVPVASQTTSMCGGGANNSCKACSGMACVNGSCMGSCSPGTGCNDMNDCTSADTCSSTGTCMGTTMPANSVCTSNRYGLCQSGACKCYQNVSPVSCTTGPSCMNWGFESGTTEGWVADMNSASAITNFTVTSSVAHSGTHALAIPLAVGVWSNNDAAGGSIQIPLCTGTGSANLAGFSFTGWVRFGPLTEGTDFPMNAANLIQAMLYPPDMVGGYTAQNPIAVNSSFINTWMQFGGSVGTISNAAYATIYVQFPIPHPASSSGDGFQATMYLDDIQISPP